MKGLPRWLLWCGLLAFAAGSVHAQSAGVIARMGFGARGMAVGNALAADASGWTSPYYNPALAPYTTQQHLGLSAALMSRDRQLQFVELGAPLRPRAGIAAGLIHAGVSKIDQRDNSGYHVGYTSVNEYAFFLAFGLRVHTRASVGVGIQLFRSDLYPGVAPARSIGFDVGLVLQLMRGLHVGGVVEDLLARYTWDTSALTGGTTSDRFPRRFRVGVSWQSQSGQLRLLGEYESQTAQREVLRRSVVLSGFSAQEVFEAEILTLHASRLRLGTEYQPVPILALRAGLDRLEEVSNGGPRPSAGFMVEQPLGLLLTRAAYTIVLEPWALGTMHLITIRFFL